MTYSRSIVDPPSRMDRLAAFRPRPLSIAELPPTRDAIAAFPLERRNIPARQRLVSRIRAEFSEMPGLLLTLAQAGRLFGLTHDACARILSALAREGLLRRHDDGTYGRSDIRP
jgi:hypothetical protein